MLTQFQWLLCLQALSNMESNQNQCNYQFLGGYLQDSHPILEKKPNINVLISKALLVRWFLSLSETLLRRQTERRLSVVHRPVVRCETQNQASQQNPNKWFGRRCSTMLTIVSGLPVSCQMSDSERGYSCQHLESSALINSFLLLGAVRSPCRFADQCWTVELKWWIKNHWSSILPDSTESWHMTIVCDLRPRTKLPTKSKQLIEKEV